MSYWGNCAGPTRTFHTSTQFQVGTIQGSGKCSCPWQGLGMGWILRILPFQSIPWFPSSLPGISELWIAEPEFHSGGIRIIPLMGKSLRSFSSYRNFDPMSEGKTWGMERNGTPLTVLEKDYPWIIISLRNWIKFQGWWFIQGCSHQSRPPMLGDLPNKATLRGGEI